MKPIQIIPALLLLALPLVTRAQSGTWSTNVANISPAHADGAAAVLNGRIYSVGGGNYFCGVFSAAQVYNPTNNTWTGLASMHTARYEFGAAELNGLIYAVGGNPGCGSPPGINVVEAYDPVSNTWSNRATLPTGGWGSSVAAANGKIYAIGGSGNPNAVYAYDPATNGWATKAACPTNNAFSAVAVVDGIIYVIGGIGPVISTSVYAYDPVTDTWTAKAPMPTARYDACAGVIDGVIYVAGGADALGTHFTKVEAYNPQANTWSTNTPMPFSLVGASSAVLGRTMYVIGGYDTGNSVVATVEAFTLPSLSITISVPANIVTEATGPSGAVVSFSTSATNSAGTVPTTNTPASGSMFPLGTNTVTVTATANGFTTNATFTVTVRDTTPPIISLLGANPLTNFVGTAFVDPGATASDVYAGNLTGAIVATGAVDTNVPGSYLRTYTVNDGQGNVATTDRTVVVVTPPPALNVAATGSQTVLFWAASGTNYSLQTTTNLVTPNWTNVTNGMQVIAIVLTNNTLPAAFFRLQAQ